MKDYASELKEFTIDSLPSLDVAVLGALELLGRHETPELAVHSFKRPLVVGSGNAEATGRIIFAKTNAIFASESSFDEKLASSDDIDEVVIISASGGKHAPLLVRKAYQAGKHVTLLTNTPASPAQRAAEEGALDVYIFPKNREPYTYNTSTYMSMIQSYTRENPSEIMAFIESSIASLKLPDFSQYDKYYLIVPPEFSGIIRMLQVKFIELFGRRIARDVETSEYVLHATTVVESNELFISFGEENTTWGDPKNRLYVPLPHHADYVAMMAIGYYIISKIQDAHPPYFKDNLPQYCATISEVFGEDIRPIVEGTV